MEVASRVEARALGMASMIRRSEGAVRSARHHLLRRRIEQRSVPRSLADEQPQLAALILPGRARPPGSVIHDLVALQGDGPDLIAALA